MRRPDNSNSLLTLRSSRIGSSVSEVQTPSQRNEAGDTNHDHSADHNLRARELACLHDNRAEPGRYAGYFPDHDDHPRETKTKPQAGENGRQAGREHNSVELSRALTAEYACRLEKPLIDRAHTENRIDKDRIKRSEANEEKCRTWTKAENNSGNQAVTGIGRKTCKVGSSNRRTIDMRPIMSPSGTASKAAMVKPP